MEIAAEPQDNVEMGGRTAIAVRRGKGGGGEGGLDRGGEGKEEFRKGGVDAGARGRMPLRRGLGTHGWRDPGC